MRPRTAYNAIYAITGLAFGMVSTIGAVYRVEEAGLDPFELVLVGTTLEATTLVFEIPTGVVADVVSRRLSIVIGAFVVGAGFVLEGLVPELWAVLAGQVVWGFGYTFISGANTAWLADELGADDLLAPALLRGSQWYQGSLLTGIAVGAGLAVIDLQVPIVIAGLSFVGLGLVLAARMPERGFSPTTPERRRSLATAWRTFVDGAGVVRSRPVLLLLLSAAVFAGASSEAVDRLWQVRFLDDFDVEAVAWFGVLNGGWALLGIAGNEIVRRRGGAPPAALVGLEAARLGGLLLFALAGRIDLAIAGFWSTQMLRQVSQPLYVAWLNTRLRSGVRATVNSMLNQVDALGQMAGGPLLGLVGRRVSVAAALVASAVVLAPAIAFVAAAAARASKD